MTIPILIANLLNYYESSSGKSGATPSGFQSIIWNQGSVLTVMRKQLPRTGSIGRDLISTKPGYISWSCALKNALLDFLIMCDPSWYWACCTLKLTYRESNVLPLVWCGSLKRRVTDQMSSSSFEFGTKFTMSFRK
ncbi:hypothetical protein AVEN_9307-1 [Araneus ventricosus]|uniref:Uncharacterized protein n=1 Tax=Araneus ventricosus TaxID=182803 RepID=A0A4Y2Q7H8_ARAVE|nr:hypothetical protein AVEN_9307-1 [Araneus ventricosus]